MTEKNRERELNYFYYFKKLYESWEKSMSQAMEVWLKSPLLGNTTEKAVEKSNEFKNYIYDIMERALSQRYLPMKADMGKVIASLDNLEVKLDKLSERIGEIQVDEKPASRRKKTRSKTRRKKRNERGKV